MRLPVHELRANAHLHTTYVTLWSEPWAVGPAAAGSQHGRCCTCQPGSCPAVTGVKTQELS